MSVWKSKDQKIERFEGTTDSNGQFTGLFRYNTGDAPGLTYSMINASANDFIKIIALDELGFTVEARTRDTYNIVGVGEVLASASSPLPNQDVVVIALW